MILLFETYSLIQIIFLAAYIRKAKAVYFHRRSFPPLQHNSSIRRIAEKFILFLNKDIAIKDPPADKTNEYGWEMNKAAVEAVEGFIPEIINSAAYRVILKIIRDNNILKCYKMKLADDISARLLFVKMSHYLIGENKNKIYLIFSDNNHCRFRSNLLDIGALASFILPQSIMVNYIRVFFQKSYLTLIFLFLPAAFIISNLKRIRFTLGRIDKREYAIAMPVSWGIHDKEIIIDGVKWAHDDTYLYNKQIKKGDIVHIFNYWGDAPETEAKYKERMDAQGIFYADKKNYKVNMPFILICLRMQFQILVQSLKNFSYWIDRYKYLTYNNSIMFWMLKKHLEFENVDYKVELIRHDYSPQHIVETILCNQNNKKTVAIQHSANAGPYVLNGLCFIHFDKYCILGERHLLLYEPFWSNLNLEKTGNYMIDELQRMAKDKPFLEIIKNKIATKYKKRKYIALISFPTPAEYNLSEKWDMIYEALAELRAVDIDCSIFLRFRNSACLENSHLKRFKNLPLSDSRFIIDLVNFSTYELIIASDVVLTSSHSSGMIEAVSIGRKAFTFDYMGTAKYSFSKYGRDIVIKDKEGIRNLFKNLENNYSGYCCDWSLLKQEYNYFDDGKSSERLQDVIYKTVQEVPEKRK